MVLDIVRNSDNVNDLLPADDPILAEHAAEIRRLGKRVIDDVVAIGRHRAESARSRAGLLAPVAGVGISLVGSNGLSLYPSL